MLIVQKVVESATLMDAALVGVNTDLLVITPVWILKTFF